MTRKQQSEQQTSWDFGTMSLATPQSPGTTIEKLLEEPGTAGLDAAANLGHAAATQGGFAQNRDERFATLPAMLTEAVTRLVDLTGVSPQERAAVIAKHIAHARIRRLTQLINAPVEEWSVRLLDWALLRKEPFRVAEACRQVTAWYTLAPHIRNQFDLELLEAMKQFWGGVEALGIAQVVNNPPIYVRMLVG